MPRSKSPSLLEGFQVDIDNRYRSYGINFDRGRSATVTSVTGTSENPAASESVDDDVVILGEFNPTQKEEQPTYLSSDTDDGGALNSTKNSSQTNNARGSAQPTKTASGKAGMERARTSRDIRDSNSPGPSLQQRRTSVNDAGLPSPVPTPPDVDEFISEPTDAVDNGVFYVGTAMHSAKPTTSINNSSCKESQRSGDKARASGRTPSWLTNSNYTTDFLSKPCHSSSLKRNAEKTPEAGSSTGKKTRYTYSSDSDDVIIVEQNDCKSKEVNDIRMDNRNLHSKSQTSTSEREPSINSVCNDDHHERSHSREENIRSDIVDYARLQVDVEGVDVSGSFERIHHETSNPRSNPDITDYQDNSRNNEPRSWRESTNHDNEGSGRDNKVKGIDARDKDVRRTSTEFRNQISSRDAGINFRARSYEENARPRYSEEEKNHKGIEEDNRHKKYETDWRGYRSGDSRRTSGENSRNGNGRQGDRHGYWHHDSRHEDRSHYKNEHLHHRNRNKHENWNRRKRSDDSYRGYGSDKDRRGKESYSSAKYKSDFSGKHREMKLQEARQKSCSDSRGLTGGNSFDHSDHLRNDDRINPTTNEQTNLQRDVGQNVSTNAAKGFKQSELVRNQIRQINAVVNGSENPKPASFENTASNERVVVENDDNFNRMRTSRFSNDRPSTNPTTPSASNQSSSAYASTPAPNTNYDDKELEIKNAEKMIEKIKTCRQCKKTFPTRKEAIEHLKKVHDKKLCFFCCVAFTTKKLVFVKHFLDAHAKDDKDQKAHCPLCMEKFGYDGIYIHLSKKHFQHLEVRHNDSKRKKTIDRKSTGKTTPPRPNYHHNRREQPVGYKRFQQNDTRRYDTYGSTSTKSSTPISKSNPFHQVNNAETHVLQKSLIQEPSNDTNASQSDNPEHNMACASRKTQFKIPKKINTE